MKKYNKLVRDKIPEIIETEGRKAKVHILSQEEYIAELDKKLIEEMNEYLSDKSLEEMADVLEVLYAICNAHGYTIEELEEKRSKKYEERGGFDKKLYLEYVEDLGTEKTGTVMDIKALKKWNKISDRDKEVLLSNVFCGSCGETTIVEYGIVDDSYGIVLQGKCIKCGGNIARYIENPD